MIRTAKPSSSTRSPRARRQPPINGHRIAPALAVKSNGNGHDPHAPVAQFLALSEQGKEPDDSAAPGLTNRDTSPAAMLAFAEMIVRWFSLAGHEQTRQAVAVADAFIRTVRGLPDPAMDEQKCAYEAIEDIAECLERAYMADAADELEEMWVALKQAGWTGPAPCDSACNHWRPIVEAALALGVACGVQLGGAAMAPRVTFRRQRR